MAGRPKKEFDRKQFASLVSLGCDEDEICWFFRDDNGIVANKDTLSRWCKRTYGLNFDEYRKQNKLMGLKIDLRKNQLALSKTSAAMAIFLGKNYLDQKDNPDNEQNADVLLRLSELLKAQAEAAAKDDVQPKTE